MSGSGGEVSAENGGRDDGLLDLNSVTLRLDPEIQLRRLDGTVV